MRKIPSETVSITPAVLAAWSEMARPVARAAVELGIRPEEIPDEEIWIKDDEKTLVIKCQAGPLLVSMEVPPGQWTWAN